MPQLSIITIKFICQYAHHFSPTGQVKFCGCASVAVYLIAQCRMSFVFILRQLVTNVSTVLSYVKFKSYLGVNVAVTLFFSICIPLPIVS